MGKAEEDITLALHEAAAGSPNAAEQLLPLVYDQLRRAAEVQIRAEGAAHTLQPTALVHEAYLRLVGPREVPWANRAHYYAAAAEAMRRILIDHARSKGARRARESAAPRFADFEELAEQDSGTILAVDSALIRLETEDPEAAQIVKLRFFSGLSVEQAAEVAGVSARTAARLWSLARAKLHRYLSENGSE